MLRRKNRSTTCRPGQKKHPMSRKKSTAVADEKPVDKPVLELTAREMTVFEKYREIHTNNATAATRMKTRYRYGQGAAGPGP